MQQHNHTELWQQRIHDWQQSGLSVAHWCQEQQLAPHCFYYWRKKLMQPGSASKPSTVSFVSLPSSPSAIAQGPTLTLTSPDGWHIQLHADCPVPLLQTLLRELSPC